MLAEVTEVSTEIYPGITMDPAIRFGKVGVMIVISEGQEAGTKLSFGASGVTIEMK